MHAQPRRELQKLLHTYGPTLIADPQRTEALLSDLCGEYQREIFVLIHAQRAHIPGELSRMIGQRAEEAVCQRLARQLQDRYAFSAEAAAWAVDAWADALHIRAVPVYQNWLRGFWHSLRSRTVALLPGRRKRFRPTQPSAPIRTDIERSIFSRIGVQWKKVSVGSRFLLLLAVLLIGTVGAAWQNGWLERVASLIVEPKAGVPKAGVVDTGWQPPASANPATALARSYPPPLEARIEADLLNVRATPDLNAAVLGKVGPVGANVTVDGYSEDGLWSHIAAPVAGWVSNEYVTVAGLYLRPALGQIIQAEAVLHNAPRTDAPVIATLMAGQTLVLVALSGDGQWRQVVEPSPGWVESRFIAAMER